SLIEYNGTLIVGGGFTMAGGQSAHGVASWNGSAWVALGTGLSGVSNPMARAMTVLGTDLIVAGSFTSAGGVPAASVARWDGSAWHSVGGDIVGSQLPWIAAATNYHNQIIVGGY